MLADRIVLLLRLLLPAALIYWVAEWARASVGLGLGLLIPWGVVGGVGLYQWATRRPGDTFENPAREEWIGGIILGAALAFVALLVSTCGRLVA